MAKTAISYLEADDISATLPEGGAQPRIEIRGRQTVLNARIRRAFPLSNPRGHISIQDGGGNEVGMLVSMEALDSASRAVFEAELDRRYFAPTISRIDSLKQDAGMWHFKVQTQRGDAQFYVRNWRDSAYESTAGRWQIQSVDGLRYSIPDLGALDERSQNLLDQVF